MTISERIFMLPDSKKMTKAEFSRQTGIAAADISIRADKEADLAIVRHRFFTWLEYKKD